MRLTPNFGASMNALPASRLLGMAVLSASALLLEIASTRLFSLIFFPPYVFFILSVAILGIGIGAALSALFPARARRLGLTFGSCGAALSTMLLLAFSVFGQAVEAQVLLFLLLALPYVFFGLVISTLFGEHASASRVLYMSDLVGAGCGALLAIPLLNRFGAVNAILLSALGFAAAALYFAAGRDRLLAIACVALTGLSFGVNASRPFLEIDAAKLAREKPIVSALADGGGILESRWDAFARSDLVDPGGGRPLRIYVDGGAASVMPAESARGDLLRDIGFFPFATEQPRRVFIIGPGAGLDVYFALTANAEQITAVEVNAASLDLVNAWRGYTGPLYDRAEVEVIVDDGRGAIRRSTEKFDLIYLSQVVSLAAERGGYALSENTIYTAEAFLDYLDHLDEDGQIALKLYDELTLTRAVSTALAAFRHRGFSDQAALKHLMAFADGHGSPPVPLLLIGASAFDEDDSLVLGAIARDVGFTPLLLPHILAQPPLDDVDSGAKPFAAIVAASEADISPASDDRPFFFQFEKGIPSGLLPLVALSIAVCAATAFVLVHRLRRGGDAVRRAYPLFFALLGVGFIALEIYAIQQTRLFLSHPTIAVTLVLATFLLGGGLGSGLSHVLSITWIERHPQIVTAVVAILAVIWSALWMPLSDAFLAADLALRGFVAVLSLLPLSICMGLPFPHALKMAGKGGANEVALAWSLNGLMTVVGSVAAVALSITAGFGAALALGAAAYLLATVVLAAVQREDLS